MNKCLCLIASALLIPSLVSAQTGMSTELDDELFRVLQSSAVTSPQVWSMVQYTHPTVSLNTGSPYVNIPLVEVNDPDFDLNLSLSYSIPGFRPLVPDNYVGMGWRLEGLGVIQREINGIPDDLKNLYGEAGKLGSTNRIITGIRNGVQGDAASLKAALAQCDTSVLNARIMSAGVVREGILTCPIETSSGIELCPDIYRFRFGNHSGKFLIDLDGSVLLVGENGGRYKVNLDHYLLKEANSLDSTLIHITSDDGFRYSFGGGYEAQEYTAVSWLDFADGLSSANYGNSHYETFANSTPLQFNRTTAYGLKRVTAPNGRTMEIEYFDDVPDGLHKAPYNLLKFGQSWNNAMPELAMYYNVTPSYSVSAGESSGYTVAYSLSKLALVKEIRTDDKRITFHYSRRDNPFFGLSKQANISEYDFVRHCGVRLDSVSVYSRTTGKCLEKTRLEFTENCGRLLLSGVQNSRRGNYQLLSYPSTTGFTSSLTINIDEWGFWSGVGANTSLFQRYPTSWICDEDNRVVIREENDKNRDPMGADYSAFMLRSVVFPTGGKVEYTYEPHEYSEFYSQDNAAYRCGMQGELSKRKIAGGARVCTETFYGGATESAPRIRLYDYNLDDVRSSGRLLREGEFYLRIYHYPSDYHVSQPHTGVMNVSRPEWGRGLARTNGVGNYIEYAQVTEYDHLSAGAAELSDSLFTYRRHPLLGDPDVSDSFTVVVGQAGPTEMFSTWTMQGGQSSVSIKNAAGTEVWSRSFNSTDSSITLSPAKAFGNGYYYFSVQITNGGYFNFTAAYPRSHTVDGQAKKVTTFSKTPAYPNLGTVVFKDPTTNYYNLMWYLKYEEPFLRNFWSRPMDWSHRGGKILSEQWYDSNGNLVRSDERAYGEQVVGDGYSIAAYPMVSNVVAPFVNIGNIIRIPMGRYLPASRRVTEYDPSGRSNSIVTAMEYDDDGYLKKTRSEDARGTEIVKEYWHPHHLSDSMMVLLCQNNVLAPIVEECWKAGAETIYRRKDAYEQFGFPWIPRLATISTSQSSSALKQRARYTEYDSYGNPVGIVVDGRNYVQLWSYRGKYPVAWIANATPSEVREALSISDLSSISKEPILETDLSILRSGLPLAQVHTYLFEPGIGLVSERGPDGAETCYSYDSAGRLSEISILNAAGQKSVLERYDYHLVNE